jgi:hypothetical protein
MIGRRKSETTNEREKIYIEIIRKNIKWNDKCTPWRNVQKWRNQG